MYKYLVVQISNSYVKTGTQHTTEAEAIAMADDAQANQGGEWMVAKILLRSKRAKSTWELVE